MLLVISYKRRHFIIPHHFLTVLKCLSACQLRKTVKYEISDNFSLTWSPKFGWLFQVIWYFDAKPFLQHYLEHCRITKYPRIQYHALLAKRNASFAKNTESALIAMGFEQFYEFQNMTYPWTFQDIERTVRHFRKRFFATCFKFSWSNTTLPGALDLDPGSQGKSMNSWCVSFETECSLKWSRDPFGGNHWHLDTCVSG